MMYCRIMISQQVILFLLAFVSYSKATRGTLTCVSCIAIIESGDNVGNNPCFHTPETLTNTVRCADEGFYCQSVFTFNDGGRSIVQRGCANPSIDHDESTQTIPSGSQCTVTTNTISRSQETKCFYSCESDFCNNVTMVAIKSCEGDCSASLGNGRCDFATGKCVCESGWGGSNCEISIGQNIPFRRCVQCSEKTDPGCRSAITATVCPGNTEVYPYCGITRTTVFDQDQNEISSHITRGCTASYTSSDECYFSESSPDPNQPDVIEYTCTSTCEKDGCNIYLPDGLVSAGETKDLQCLVCESSDDSSDCALGNLQRTRCPPNMHYCKSTVSYYITDRKDLTYKAAPEYKFGRITRKCARHAVASKCKQHRLGEFHASKVKCEETCKSDGCNVGWPNRPKCSQCISNYSPNGYDSCWSDPDPPKQCSKPYEEYCVSKDSQLKSGATQNGYRRFIQRGCSYHNIGAKCSDEMFGEIEVQNCNRTCTTTGCNLGVSSLPTSSATTITSSGMFILLCLLLQWFFSHISES